MGNSDCCINYLMKIYRFQDEIIIFHDGQFLLKIIIDEAMFWCSQWRYLINHLSSITVNNQKIVSSLTSALKALRLAITDWNTHWIGNHPINISQLKYEIIQGVPKRKWDLLLLLQVLNPTYWGTPCTIYKLCFYWTL